jgi:cytochrome bd-type quinol oxidase subunit 1
MEEVKVDLPIIEFPAVGRMGIIGIIALIHIIFANFAVGGPVLALIAQRMGIKKKDKNLEKFAKDLIVLVIIMMSLGGIFGVGIVALCIGLFPTFFAKTVNVFFWPLFIEVLLFVVEFAFLALYRYQWDKLENNRSRHMLYGIIGAVGSWGSMIIINAAASFMMTPGKWVQTQSLLDAILNPTMVPSLLHRICGSLAIAGLISMLMVMKSTDKKYRSETLSFASKWVIIPTALNVIPGLWYLFSLPEFARGYLLGGVPNIYLAWGGGIVTAIVAIGISVLIMKSPAKMKNGMVIASFVLIVLTIWGMGFTREAARKPYLVSGAIYANEISVGQEQTLMKNGSSGDQAPDGAKLFAKQCSACHTLNGLLGAERSSSNISSEMLRGLLNSPDKFRHPYMPPFFGTEAEMDALIKYLGK